MVIGMPLAIGLYVMIFYYGTLICVLGVNTYRLHKEKRKATRGEGIVIKTTATLMALPIIALFCIIIYFSVSMRNGPAYADNIETQVIDNNIDRIKELLEQGIDPDQDFGNTFTPLMRACRENNGEAARLLIEYGADVNKEFGGNDDGAHKGQTPIFYAIRRDMSPEIIEILIESGADLTHAADDGTTPLEYAEKCEVPYQILKILREELANQVE